MSEADIIHVVPPAVVTSTIPNGTKPSGSVDYRQWITGIVILPAAFTGSALTFKVSADGTNFSTLFDGAGSAVTIGTVAAGEAFALPSQLASAAYFQVLSGSNEGADRVLTFSFKS